MAKKRKQRLCRICKKRPVWIGGDVKNPGRVCKKCYHAHVWPERMARRGQKVQGADTPEERGAVNRKQLSELKRPYHTKRWNRAVARFHLSEEELAMAQATGFTPILMDEVVLGFKRSRHEKRPLTATPDEIKTVKREIRERYAAKREREQRELGMTTFTLMLPADLVARMKSHCARHGLRLSDEIEAALKAFVAKGAASAKECASDPVVTQPSSPAPTRFRLRLVRRTAGR